MSDVDSVVTAFVRGLGLPRRNPATERAELPAQAKIAEHLEIIRRLGAGAMGVVYLARENRLRRDVAVKLVGVERGAAALHVEREAQAMARLAHPNVLVVHEVGHWHDGVYIAMEYVDGGTMRGWLAESPRAWRDIVAVFVQAARGLHAAHLAGLSHQDFKPDNVLIGRDPEGARAFGRVRVGDFGLARSKDDGGGRLAGTPGYIAPEQVRERADGPLADQFAFGVSLYEALCGHRPYPGSESWTAVSADLRRPPAHLPRWLRTLMVRTVALDPRERFADLGIVADALDDGLWLASRRRRAVVIGGLVALTAVVGLGLGSRFSARDDPSWSCGEEAMDGVWNSERAARITAALASTESPIQAEVSRDVVARIDAWAASWREQRSDACRATHERGEQSSELLDRRMACLDRRLAGLDVALEVLGDVDRETVVRAVDLVADLPALDACADAERLLADVAPPEDPELVADVEAARRELAKSEAAVDFGRYPDAVAIAKTVREGAAAAAYAPLRAEASLALGTSQARSLEFDAAEAALEQAFHEAMAAGHDEVVADAARELVCNVARNSGGTERARAWLKTAEAADERIDARVSERKRLQYCRASLHEKAGEYALAEAVLREALADPVVDPADELGPAVLHDMLGSVLQRLGRAEEARREHQMAYDMIRAARGPTHPSAVYARSNLGYARESLGEAGAAVAIQLDSLQNVIALHGPESAAVLNIYNNLALALGALDARPQAMAYLERGIEIARKHPDQARALALLLGNLASNANWVGDNERAVDLAREVITVSEASFGPQHVNTAYGRVALASALSDVGRRDEATAEYERALEILGAVLGETSTEVGIVRLNLAIQAGEAGDSATVERNLELAERAAIASSDRRIQAGVLRVRSRELRRKGDREGARALDVRAVELMKDVDRAQYRESLHRLGLDDLELGDAAAAMASFELARSLAETAGSVDGVAANEFAMARAAWELGQRDRARTLAAAALAGYESLAAADNVAEVRAWSKRHRHGTRSGSP